MNKRILASLLSLVLVVSLLPVSAGAVGEAEGMPRAGFKVMLRPHHGGGDEDKYYYDGDTIAFDLGIYSSSHVRPFIEGDPKFNSFSSWTGDPYYTFTLSDVVNGEVSNDSDLSVFGIEKVYERRNAGKNVITLGKTNDLEENLKVARVGDSYYKSVVKRRIIGQYSPNLSSDTTTGTSTSQVQVDVYTGLYSLDDIQIDKNLDQIYSSGGEGLISAITKKCNKTNGESYPFTTSWGEKIVYYSLRDIPISWSFKESTGYDPAPGATNTLVWTAKPEDAPQYKLQGWRVMPDVERSGEIEFQNPYRVTFQNGDQTVEKLTKKGSTVTAPEVTGEDGAFLQGWYTADGKKWDFSQPVSENLVLTAKWSEILVIKPADLTKYETAPQQHEDEHDESNCFPEPIYEGIPEGATIKVKGTAWSVAETGYPFTVAYYDPEGYVAEPGKAHPEGTYTAKIVPVEHIDLTDITVDDAPVVFQDGKLFIWDVSHAEGINEDVVSPVETSEPTDKVDAATAVIADDVTFLVNNISGEEVGERAVISLLHDELRKKDAGDDTYMDAMIARLGQEDGIGSAVSQQNRRFSMKYLDFIDTDNSNVLVCATGNVDIYLPYPDDTDKNTDFQLFRYGGLNRSYTEQGYGAGAVPNIEGSNLEALMIEKTDNGIRFTFTPTVDESGNYSVGAMALTWTEPSTEPTPTPDPGAGGDQDDDDYTLYYHSNFGSDKSFYQTQSTSAMKVRDYGDMKRLPVRDGYEFLCWNTEKDGSGRDYAPGDTYRVSGTSSHLYAQWVRTATTPDDTGVSHWLNTHDHMAYLSGYANGNFGPDDNMTRAQAAQMFYRLLLKKDVPITVQFSDVPADAWYATAVNTLASLGIVKGIGDHQFAPECQITRAEFTVIAMRFGRLDTSGSNIFTDVKADDWFYDQVVGAIKHGWIGGYADGTFRPYNTVTRAEVTAIVNRMLDRAADTDFVAAHADGLRKFSDVPASYWAYDQIMEATNAHEYRGSSGGEKWTGLVD